MITSIDKKGTKNYQSPTNGRGELKEDEGIILIEKRLELEIHHKRREKREMKGTTFQRSG